MFSLGRRSVYPGLPWLDKRETLSVKVIYWLIFHGLRPRTLTASRMAERVGSASSSLRLSAQPASRFVLT